MIKINWRKWVCRQVVMEVQQPKRIELIVAIGFKYIKPRTDSEILLTPDTFYDLKELEKSVTQQGGQLKINSIYRSWEKQQELFNLHAKEPKKYPVASAPGKSFHQSGRAIDFAIQELNFRGVPKEKWLEKFWSLYIPLGFTPIIDKPDMDMSESWHVDHLGPWTSVRTKLGYLTTAQCAILDVGNWNPKEESVKEKKMFIQSQLLRLGRFEIGRIDGILGNKSKTALDFLGINSQNIDEIIEKIKKT